MTGSRNLALAGAAIGLVAFIGLGWVFLPSSGEPGSPALTDLDALDVAAAARIRELIAAVEDAPRDAVRRGRLGMAYQANDVRQAALRSFEQAVQLDQSEPKWWYFLALARSLLGDVEGATAALDEVIARNERYVPAHWRRGELLRAQGDWDAAERAFRRALAINPGEPAALRTAALARLDEEARKDAPA